MFFIYYYFKCSFRLTRVWAHTRSQRSRPASQLPLASLLSTTRMSFGLNPIRFELQKATYYGYYRSSASRAYYGVTFSGTYSSHIIFMSFKFSNEASLWVGLWLLTAMLWKPFLRELEAKIVIKCPLLEEKRNWEKLFESPRWSSLQQSKWNL